MKGVFSLLTALYDPVKASLIDNVIDLLLGASSKTYWTKKAIERIDKGIQDLINREYRAGHLFVLQAKQAKTKSDKIKRLDDALKAFTRAASHTSVPLQSCIATVLVGSIYDIKKERITALYWYEQAWSSCLDYETKLLDQKPDKLTNHIANVTHYLTFRISSAVWGYQEAIKEWTLIVEIIELHKYMRELCALLKKRESKHSELRAIDEINTRIVYGELVFYPQIASGVMDHKSTRHWFKYHFGSNSHRNFKLGFKTMDFINSMEDYPEPKKWRV